MMSAALSRALRRWPRSSRIWPPGQPWRAASDQRVSPTYVPDLVNVALDLLIDGTDGIWHLANEGDISWSELARKRRRYWATPTIWSRTARLKN